MILVDTSIWIGLLGASKKTKISPDQLLEFATCLPVIQEVLQGVGNDLAHQKLKEGLLALPRFGDPLSEALFIQAADIFRLGRRKGFTIRSSTDCLIASIALQHGLPVWHADRDFEMIAKFTGLKTVV
jgi:predicted nucleic acid-binding protein